MALLERPPIAPVGDALRDARIAAGLSVPELAFAAGVGARTIERLERGIGKPHRSTLIAIAVVLPETSEDLAGNEVSTKLADPGDEHSDEITA